MQYYPEFQSMQQYFLCHRFKDQEQFLFWTGLHWLKRTEKPKKWSSTHRITVTSHTIQLPKMAKAILGPIRRISSSIKEISMPSQKASSPHNFIWSYWCYTALVIFAAEKMNLGRSWWKAGIWGMKGLWSLPGSRGAAAYWVTLLNRRPREDVAPACKYGRRINAGGKAGIIVTDLT